MKLLNKFFVMAFLSATFMSNAGIILETSDPGYYNDSIGTVLNLTNGGDTATGYFPVFNDSYVTYTDAPDLSAASGILGDWLTDPLNLNSNWSFETSIPNTWTPGHEVAVMYQFDTLSATNVIASFGVDNGIHAWLDGVYIGGVRSGGHSVPGEHVFTLGDLSSGTHFLQLLLEDHGGANGYHVEISADEFIPGPPPAEVSEPTNIAIFSLSLLGLATMRRKKAK